MQITNSYYGESEPYSQEIFLDCKSVIFQISECFQGKYEISVRIFEKLPKDANKNTKVTVLVKIECIPEKDVNLFVYNKIENYVSDFSEKNGLNLFSFGLNNGKASFHKNNENKTEIFCIYSPDKSLGRIQATYAIEPELSDASQNLNTEKDTPSDENCSGNDLT